MERSVSNKLSPADNVKRAWIWLALVTVGSIAGQLVGHLISWAFGQVEGMPFAGPMWQKLLIVIPSSLLIVIPGTVAAFYGSRVVREGNRIGYVHIIIGGLYSLFMLVVSVLTTFGVGQ